MTSQLIAQLHVGTHAAIAAVIWGGLTCLVPMMPAQWQVAAFWTMVVVGVPVLGWLTFAMGPGAGVGALALGLVLIRLTLTRLTLTRRALPGKRHPATATTAPPDHAGSLPRPH